MTYNPSEFHQQLITQARWMRAHPTRAEALLWTKLRKRKLGGYRFLRQRIFGPYIVDFYCAEAGLIIEIDGPIHQSQKEYDEERTRFLQSLGKKVIRFKNHEVFESINEILNKIKSLCKT